MKKLFLIIIMIFFIVVSIGAATDTTQYAGEAMAIGVGARPLGMGGTFAAIADDASTSYWNPAGLVNVKGVEVSSVKLTTQENMNELDTRYSYVNLVYNVGPKIGSFGVGWLRQAIGDIKLTDEYGNIIGNPTENSDNVFYLAYGRWLTKGLSMGLALKILMGNYPALVYSGSTPQETEISYSGFGLDIGMYFDAAPFVKELKGLSLGVNIQDVYTTLNWDAIEGLTEGGTEQVDINIKPGIAYKLPIQQFEIIAGVDMDTKYQMVIHAGAEVWWNKMIAIRGGIKNWGSLEDVDVTQLPDWSLGASVRWYFIGVDYAYVNNELAPVHYLSVIGKF